MRETGIQTNITKRSIFAGEMYLTT